MKKRLLPLLLTAAFLCAPLSACQKGQEATLPPKEIPSPVLPDENDEEIELLPPTTNEDEEGPVAETPIEQSPIEQAPIEQSPIEQAPEKPLERTPTTQPEAEPTPPEAEPTPPTQPEQKPEPKPEPTISEQTYVKCLCDGLNIRSGPSTSHSSFGTLEKDTFYPYFGKEGTWYKTCYKGKTAYVSASESYTTLVKMKTGSERVEAVIQKGYECLGVKYVYGAERLHDGNGNLSRAFSKTAFDCSSLIQYIFYYGADVLLNVTTRTQVVQGVKVEKSELKRGDCIYFTNASRVGKTGIERVGHVALYLGDGYILHTASDYCKIEKMNQTRWNYYIEARRFI